MLVGCTIGRKLLIVMLTVLSASMLVVVSFKVPPQVAAISPPTFTLIGIVAAWNNTGVANPTITAVQGQTLTIQLSSGDAESHRFFVDVDKNGVVPDCPGPDPCSNPFPPSTTFPFTVTFAPGTYTYYCVFHPTTMLGQFIVLQSPGGGGGHRVIL